MIQIINITEAEHQGLYGIGIQIYACRINKKELFRFKHKFEDGLSRCLYKAAKQAELYESKKVGNHGGVRSESNTMQDMSKESL